MTHPLFPYLVLQPSDLIGRPVFAALDSDEIDELCASVTEEIENLCERKFVQRPYVAEVRESTGTFHLRIRNPPLISISEIRRDGVPVDLTGIKVVDAETGRLYNPAKWGPRPVFDQGAVVGLSDPVPSVAYSEQFGDGSRPILWEFDYVGGFARVPSIVRRAAIEWATMALSGLETQGMKSESIGGYSYTLATPSEADPNAGKIPSFESLLAYRIAPGVR